MPHEMGELFKVIALSKNIHDPLSGFSNRNRAHLLNDG
jgi:SAM-dependent MidA family methyltransferase